MQKEKALRGLAKEDDIGKNRHNSIVAGITDSGVRYLTRRLQHNKKRANESLVDRLHHLLYAFAKYRLHRPSHRPSLARIAPPSFGSSY